MAKRGYNAAFSRFFFGVREHIIYTPEGDIVGIAQVPGNRHDINGLYEFLKQEFKGRILADSAYWAGEGDWEKLAEAGIEVVALPRKNQKFKITPIASAVLKGRRGRVERRVGLLNRQYNAGTTLNHNESHYRGRRLTKANAHNTGRRINVANQFPCEATIHFKLAC